MSKIESYVEGIMSNIERKDDEAWRDLIGMDTYGISVLDACRGLGIEANGIGNSELFF